MTLKERLNASKALWVVSDSKDNADAIATKAGESGKRHYILSVSASFSGSATKLLQIKDGDTVIFEKYIVNEKDINFDIPLVGSIGNSVSAVLGASGILGIIGKVVMRGITIKE